jgi:uncharacterized OsmC-like protein
MALPDDPRTDPATLRGIELARLDTGRYQVVNRRGGRLDLSSGETDDFTPVELLLAAIAGCSAIDVGLITGKRAAPDRFEVRAEGHKIRDDRGNHLVDLRVTFDVSFPEGPAGDAAREALPRALAQTRDRLCTVSRTVALGEPVEYVVGGDDTAAGPR